MAKAKRKKKYVPKGIRLPKLATQQRDFAEIDKFMRNLELGYVEEAVIDGEPRIISTTIENETYGVLNAMTGWCDCFRDLAKAINYEGYDEAPMRFMIMKLRNDEPLNRKLIQEVKEVVEQQRRIYMLAPAKVVNYVSNTLLAQNGEEYVDE